MKKLFFTLIFSSLIAFQSCSSNSRSGNEIKDSTFQTGKIIPKVECRFDNNQSYVLYLPSNYTATKKWPIVYAFDPHGCGMLPVELFKEEAEKYGYILVGSNNSKNGTPWNLISEIYDTLYNDTHRRFSIDNKRVYAAGFSGGSRVAGSIALSKGGINTVIGCGAGLGSQQQTVQQFSYFGIAGKADMNLNEMMYLDTALQKAGFRHYLETFDGKHEWPNKSVAADAFLWLELNAMRDRLISKNDTLINNRLAEWKKSFQTLNSREKRYYDSYLLAGKIISFFDGLSDVSDLKAERAKLEGNAMVIQTKKHLVQIARQETGLQATYANAITSQPVEWWKTQTALFNQKIKSTSDIEEKVMYQRVLSYLSLITYMNVNGALKSGKLDNAEKLNSIYALIDPENPEHAYISATLAMKQSKPQDALNFLEEAAKLGFKEPERLDKDSIMIPLKQQPKYSGILDSIKANKGEK